MMHGASCCGNVAHLDSPLSKPPSDMRGEKTERKTATRLKTHDRNIAYILLSGAMKLKSVRFRLSLWNVIGFTRLHTMRLAFTTLHIVTDLLQTSLK